MVSIGDLLFDELYQYIEAPLRKHNVGNVVGFYLNLYENGDMFHIEAKS